MISFQYLYACFPDVSSNASSIAGVLSMSFQPAHPHTLQFLKYRCCVGIIVFSILEIDCYFTIYSMQCQYKLTSMCNNPIFQIGLHQICNKLAQHDSGDIARLANSDLRDSE